MGTVAYPYTPVDGNTFLPDGFNRDVYSPTVGESVYETTNGRAADSNFAVGQTVQPEHVRAGQVTEAFSDGLVRAMDIYHDQWAQSSAFRPLAGCFETFHQKWDTEVALLNFQLFCSANRLAGPRDAGRVLTAAPRIYLVPTIDGVQLPHLQQEMPETFWYDNVGWTDPMVGVPPNGSVHYREAFNTRCFHLSHLKFNGGSSGIGADRLLAGEHHVGVEVRLEFNGLVNRYNIDGYAKSAWYEAIHRLRVGVRHVDVIALF